MRALIQRVRSAQVTVDGREVGAIDQGILALIGIGKTDHADQIDKMLDKLLNYRLFNDETGRMGKSLLDIGGGLLLVSQFTLMADTQKGRRPDFGPAMPPDQARVLFEALVSRAKERYLHVESGVFGANMQVSLCNDGPVTLMLECL